MNSVSNDQNSNQLNDLLNLDKISVKVAPEKKGLILKHIEYEIKSQRYKCVVQRRFKEFVSLYDLLIIKFQFRLIPSLPSKKFYGNGDIHFVEERRKALERFLNLMARHPVLSSDSLVYFFLTAKNDELEVKIKDSLKNPLEEFAVFSENNNKEGSAMAAMDKIDKMDMAKYPLVKEQLRALQQSLIKLSQTAVKTLELTKSGVIETLDFGKEMKELLTSSDENLLFNDFKSKINTENIFSQFISISEQTNSEVQLLEERVVEPINIYLDLISAYKDLINRKNEIKWTNHFSSDLYCWHKCFADDLRKPLPTLEFIERSQTKTFKQSITLYNPIYIPDLCDRYENDLRKHSKDTNSVLKRQTSRQSSIEESLEELERKSHFALHCILNETLLLKTYSQSIPFVLKNLVKLKIDSHNKFAQLFNSMNI